MNDYTTTINTHEQTTGWLFKTYTRLAHSNTKLSMGEQRLLHDAKQSLIQRGVLNQDGRNIQK